MSIERLAGAIGSLALHLAILASVFSFQETTAPPVAHFDVSRPPLEPLQTISVSRLLEASGPRAISGDRCIVYVMQNERGNFIDIDLYECSRDPEEQQGLAHAIRAASPLPRPPEGLSMGSHIRLDASSL